MPVLFERRPAAFGNSGGGLFFAFVVDDVFVVGVFFVVGVYFVFLGLCLGLGGLEVMVLDGVLVHNIVNVAVPLVLGFAELVHAFAERAEKFGYFLGSEEKKNDKEDDEKLCSV